MAAEAEGWGECGGRGGERRPPLAAQSYVNRPEVDLKNPIPGLRKATACVNKACMCVNGVPITGRNEHDLNANSDH